MMATQSTFLCECGEILGRMQSSMKWLPWNTEKGDPAMKGMLCNKCTRQYKWIQPSKSHGWVDVVKCCEDFTCRC